MEMKKVKSGNIREAGFENGTMRVIFKSGMVYDYPNVTEDEYRPFAETFAREDVSSGSYFAKHFKGREFTRQEKP